MDYETVKAYYLAFFGGILACSPEIYRDGLDKIAKKCNTTRDNAEFKKMIQKVQKDL